MAKTSASKTRKPLVKPEKPPRIENLLLDQTEDDLKRLDAMIKNHKQVIEDHTYRMGLIMLLKGAVEAKVNGFAGAKLSVDLGGMTIKPSSIEAPIT